MIYAIDHGNRTRFLGLDSIDNTVHILDMYKQKDDDNRQIYSKATNIRVDESVFTAATPASLIVGG